MKRRFFWVLFTPIALILLSAFGSLLIVESLSVNRLLQGHTARELQDMADVLTPTLITGGTLDQARIDEICRSASGVNRIRITVLNREGTVLGDSENDPALMENHASRPEIHQALMGNPSSSLRLSTTLKENMLYLAVPLKSGSSVIGVLRVSRSVRFIEEARTVFLVKSLIAASVVLLLALLTSVIVARKIDGPVLHLVRAAREFADGNFHHTIRIPGPEELRTLGRTMTDMAAQLSDRINTISSQRNQLEAILANMIEPVILLDEDLVITRMNKAAAGLFGTDEHKSGSRTLIEAIRNAELYDLAREATRSMKFLEKPITLKGSREIHLQVHLTPLADDLGNCTGLLLVMNNITRMVQLENIRKDFVANVSHELKTPITTIQGFAEILRSGTLTDSSKQAEYLEIVAKQADRMNSIINDLLQLSSLENHELKPEAREPNSLVARLENARMNCRVAAGRKKIELDLTGGDDLTVIVNGFLLEQAVTNLVDNAVKYGREGSRVSIRYGVITDRKGWFEIAVADQGCGIPEADLPHVFERFYRVDKARSRELGGTGLGLSIVKHIVQAHNGELKADSEPGKGSVFTIRMPGVTGTPS